METDISGQARTMNPPCLLKSSSLKTVSCLIALSELLTAYFISDSINNLDKQEFIAWHKNSAGYTCMQGWHSPCHQQQVSYHQSRVGINHISMPKEFLSNSLIETVSISKAQTSVLPLNYQQTKIHQSTLLKHLGTLHCRF